MKTFILLLIALPSLCFAQSIHVPEPEFINNVHYLVDANAGATVKLEQQIPHQKTRANVASYFVSFGGAKTLMKVQGATSPVQVRRHSDVQFIVRAASNDFDPTTLFQIIRLDQAGNWRRAEVASINALGAYKQGKLDYIPFAGQKYGESSYILQTEEYMEPGEYAIRINTQNTMTANNVTQTGQNEVWHLFSVN